MKRYRVAQVGIGNRGKVHANAFLELADRYELVGLCDIDRPKLDAYAQSRELARAILFDDAEQMLAKTRPDVFCFVLMPHIRLPMVELAARYGVKGLAFEKPMATSLAEAWNITRVCRERGIRTVVSHQQKYLTSFQKLKGLLDAGEVGQVLRIDASCQAWLSQLGTHYMDYLLWANGGHRARWVMGHVHGKGLLSDSHPSPDYTMGRLELENGVHAFYEFGRLSPSYMDRAHFWVDNRLTVRGTEGYAWCDTDGRWGALTRSSAGKVIGESGPTWGEQEPTRLQPLYLAELADWLDGSIARHSCDVEQAYHGYEILEATCISALEKRRVDLPLDPASCGDVIERMRTELPDCPEREGREQ
jgi:predicted dehydrogenase